MVLKDVIQIYEIHKGSKSGHLTTISQQTGIPFSDILFLDNERGNCKTVAKLGVTVAYTPDGVTEEAWTEAIDKFPAPGQIFGPRGYR